jgi:hypothetical protein
MFSPMVSGFRVRLIDTAGSVIGVVVGRLKGSATVRWSGCPTAVLLKFSTCVTMSLAEREEFKRRSVFGGMRGRSKTTTF